MPSRFAFTTAAAVLLTFTCAPWAVADEHEAAGQQMAEAADAFLESLTDRQREIALLDYDHELRTRWHYWPWPLVERTGLTLNDMNKQQRELALALLEASMSPSGYEQAIVTMDLESIIHEIEYDGPIRDPRRYHFTIFGEPSNDAPWSFSIEGHHLAFNFVVHGGKLVNVTPAFLGANPAIVHENAGVGPEVGTRNMEAEETLAFELIDTLSEVQREQVVVASTSAMDMEEGHKPQAEPIDPAPGLVAADMTEQQRDLLRQLIATYVSKTPEELAEPYMDRVNAELDETHFAWFGPTELEGSDRGYSYRIQSPTFMIVLYNNQADPSGNHPNHIHSLWRTFGKDFQPALDE